MLAGIATDEQAAALVGAWLTNKSRFCVPASADAWPPAQALHEPSANQDQPARPRPQCYWGMPSISADDPDYMVADTQSGIYWRGENWAPQSFLVFLGLQRYAHLAVAREALEGLNKQALDLMMSVWRPHHHICENYPSVLRNDTADGNNECTGTTSACRLSLGAEVCV